MRAQSKAPKKKIYIYIFLQTAPCDWQDSDHKRQNKTNPDFPVRIPDYVALTLSLYTELLTVMQRAQSYCYKAKDRRDRCNKAERENQIYSEKKEALHFIYLQMHYQ